MFVVLKYYNIFIKINKKIIDTHNLLKIQSKKIAKHLFQRYIILKNSMPDDCRSSRSKNDKSSETHYSTIQYNKVNSLNYGCKNIALFS